MVLSIDASLLTSYYQARSGVGFANLSSGSGTGTAKKTPTPPWDTKSTAPKMSELVKTVLQGSRFIDPGQAKLDATSTNAKVNQDYKSLFGLYQGLNALEGLAEQMGIKGVSNTQKTQIQARFAAGLKEVQTYLGSGPFATIDMVQGTIAASAKSTAGVKKETDVYTTGVVHTGPTSAEVAAFQGAVKFSLEVKKLSGTVVTVDFDLAEMGATPRTMGATIAYMNDKLTAAGVSTRFGTVYTPGVPQTTQAGGKTVTLGTSPDTYALKIMGVSTEALTFTAPTASPAVYLAETSGLTATTTTTTAAAKTTEPVQKMLKFETDAAGGATTAADGQVFAKSMDEGIKAVRASVTGSDGSLYVLADVGDKVDGQPIKGTQDVALMKYDSAGNLVFTRTLGAADSASGFALTVSADGTKIGVAGSVSGTFDIADSTNAAKNGTDSFVSLFTADGSELWTQRRGGTGDDQVDALTIGADGVVYLAGRSTGAMPGAASVGGQDGYVSAFAGSSTTALDGKVTWTVSPKFTVQFGTAGIDEAAGIALSGNTLVVASQENGNAVVRRYDLQPTGAPVLGTTRNLGALQGGEVTGVGFASDGSVIVAGSTGNPTLAAGTVTTAHDGGRDVFVAKLAGDLVAAGTDRLSYYGGATTRTASAVAVSGDKVFLTGQVAITPPPGQTSAHDGYAAEIDPATGAVIWTRQFQGVDKEAAPSAIAVDQTGASSLDRLGLPRGKIDFTGSSASLIGGTVGSKDLLTAVTSLRPGDRFFLSANGGVAKSVTIEASDTLKTLATKISRATGFYAKVEVASDQGYDRLKITPNATADVEIRAGDTNRDALASLGLVEGLLSKTAGALNTEKKSYALELPSTIGLDSEAAITDARSKLMNAISTVRRAFREMIAPPVTAKAPSAPVPAYITNQIANYSQALARLTGGG